MADPVHDCITIVGGGLAGSEAAWQAAQSGLDVNLVEMRPIIETGAHKTDQLAELVCSNSFGSQLPDRPSGILLDELKQMGSLLIDCAASCSIPAGSALAVDREKFSGAVTNALANHSRIKVTRGECETIPEGMVIIATGPLTSPGMMISVQTVTGSENLYFFDAIAPIIEEESINFDIAYRASRYGTGVQAEGDYINCPLSKDEYHAFIEALITAKQCMLHDFDQPAHSDLRSSRVRFFEACLPVEEIARRNPLALAFGPMRPVGLRNPRTGKRQYAVVQLRQDNIAGSLFNLVGFQTNLLQSEQERVFRMIPGLENAVFVRYGQMHRNTYISSPVALLPTLQSISRYDLFFAGQITGVEGYLGSIATGLLAGKNAARLHLHQELLVLPPSTMLGALVHYITHADPVHFQPMKANLGILQPLDDPPGSRRDRSSTYAHRAKTDLTNYLSKVKP